MKTRNIVILSIVVIGASVGGYFLYRRIRTNSDSAEKNNRRIRIKVNKTKNTPIDSEVEEETTNQNI
jgi:hypothetical protein